MKLGSGNFVRTAEVSSGETIVFKDEGSWVENTLYKYPDGNPKMDFIVKVELNGEERSMRLNKTNRDIIIAAYGNETKDWIGKTATITKEKMLVAGKRVDAIILEIEGSSVEEIETPEEV